MPSYEAAKRDRQRKISAAHRRLLGKRVTVTLAGPPSHPRKVIVTGRLLGFSTAGEFEIEDGCGDIHYCWPMLDIEEA